ncbi:hypothetical protein H257_10664 [Aphanomyces astaci]|uniref:Uncharacterized protein n=1 Tax=Aphanomyces astaci TaxID=112090 RepID=W4G5Y3_APHAT|nr:hypothetical protein H257_10664 [Aphanomyces astaci]ETV75065.1 hypothetical protein H257_10664 [Aphanomyces astaci]|eukprot:XP_009835569.1 hypothetical protein H257_10664 [Aphanomyces astaci]
MVYYPLDYTTRDGDTELAQAVNTGIKQRRRAHDDTPAAIGTNLRQAKARRTLNIGTWLGQRHKTFSAAPPHHKSNESLHEGDDADHRAGPRTQGVQGTDNYSNTDQTRPNAHRTIKKARQTEAAARTTPV